MSDKRYNRAATRGRGYKNTDPKKTTGNRKPQEHNERNIRHFNLALEIMQQHQTTEKKALRMSQGYTENHNVTKNSEDVNKIMLQHECNIEKMNGLTIDDTHYSNRVTCNFKQLEELLKKQPREILLTLNLPRSGFIELLNCGKIKTEMMNLLMFLLAKVCMAEEQQNIAVLFNKVISESHFFHQHLCPYITSIEKLNISDFSIIDSLTNIVLFLSKFLQILPVSASNALSFVLPALCNRVRNLERKGLFLSDEIKNKLQMLKDSKEAIVKEYDFRTREKISANEKLHAKEPPEDYRTIPILPTKKDFMEVHPFLRPNIVHGSYIDVSHYLDVQFRLLREDYVRPFRESVRSYINHQKHQMHKKEMKKKMPVYKDVHVLCPYNTEGGLVHLISFDVKPFQHVQWEASKRLLSGSLLCLSSDNFDFMLFATVAKRDPVELAKGKLEVHFEQLGEEIFSISPSTSFVMVESEAYFEAFRHTLAALQQMEHYTLPLKEYIVHVEKDVRFPRYLCSNTMYNFSSTFNIENGFLHQIPVLKTDNWPSNRDLGLDQSQYSALQAALTKAFAIIQGPPGTGKTYIGLKITQMLMENFKIWKEGGHCPILVVCYTNHALDQFLEGILSFTKDVVRIGGRCNNSAIKQYQLSELRQVARAARQVPKDIYLQRRSVFERIELIENSINCYTHMVENSTQQILPIMFLEAFMGNAHLHSLRAGPLFQKRVVRSSPYTIAEWLGIPDEYFDSWNGDFSGDEEVHRPSTNQSNKLDCREDDIEFELSLREIDTDEYEHVNPKRMFNKISNQEYKTDERKLQGGYHKIRQYIRKQMTCQDMMTTYRAKQINNVWRLQPVDRWRLYRLWVAQYVANLFNIIAELHKCYHYESELLRELRNDENKYLLRNAKVVGMTTTGAGKYRDLLQELQPRIVIVEEAAEVLEAHIVTSLAINTEHLILIGDHQQLRPSPTVYELAVHYSLDISLFERMIKNGMTCHQLTQQHRMRPCISSLLTHIYSHLQNHPSVYNYENVLGVAHNMYFINHSYKESSISDTDSYSNIHEAKFLVALCRYLRHQRYEASQITVLTTYSGQLFLLKRLMKGDSLFEKVRVTVVDNFQGEENDIILLSFVRSNDKGSIGFLKVSNRVCVALSRAKKGLYCIGNFDLLAKESTLWENIIRNVQAQGIIGQSLALTCQNHPETVTNVQLAEDFLNYVPDGGCTKPCTFLMDCGHICTRSCHPYDLDHTAFKCKEDCLKMCDQGHKCKKPCFKECGKCTVPVEKLIPRCGHRRLVPCHLDSSEFACPVVCNKMLPCGHFCSKACYKACDPCVKMTRRMFNCGHCVDILCSENTADLTCPTLCNRKLSCGHYCKRECGIIPCPPCKRQVKKQLPCGHEREIICSEFLVKNIDKCNLACAKLLDCKHKCQRICGHKGVCGPCRQPCKRRLLCGDKCRLKCSEICPQLCKTCKPVQQQNLHLNMNGVTKWGNSLGNLYGKKSLPFDYNFFIE